MKNKFVVYTALFGDYDDLIEPIEKYSECDFICFTDQKHLKSDIWDIKIIEECDLIPNMMNRKYKILPHLFLSEYENSLYVDANIAIIGNPINLAKKYLDNFEMVIPKHFERNCIYKEAKECIRLGRSTLKETVRQMNKYKNDDFPREFGLAENNIILRKHNSSSIVETMNIWWNELNNETKRDQLSLGYVLWKNKKQFNFMFESSRNKNSYFLYFKHKKEKNINLYNKFIIRLRRKLIEIFIKI